MFTLHNIDTTHQNELNFYDHNVERYWYPRITKNIYEVNEKNVIDLSKFNLLELSIKNNFFNQNFSVIIKSKYGYLLDISLEIETDDIDIESNMSMNILLNNEINNEYSILNIEGSFGYARVKIPNESEFINKLKRIKIIHPFFEKILSLYDVIFSINSF